MKNGCGTIINHEFRFNKNYKNFKSLGKGTYQFDLKDSQIEGLQGQIWEDNDEVYFSVTSSITPSQKDIENLKQSKDRLEKLDIIMSFEDMSKDILTSDILEV